MIKVIVTQLGKRPRTVVLTADRSRLIRKYFTACPYDMLWSMRCHMPPYQIETQVNGVVLYRATICWTCFNVHFIKPKGRGMEGFDARAPAGIALKKALDALFEETKVPE